MKKFVGVLLLISVAALAAASRGTPAEAKAMLAKAVAHYKKVGRTQALKDFNSRKPPFFDRDLYVACIASNGITVANGGYPSLVGQSVSAWKDADGKPLDQAARAAAAPGGKGTISYRWFNPVSHKIEPKVSFVQKVGDDMCVVGAYNPR